MSLTKLSLAGNNLPSPRKVWSKQIQESRNFFYSALLVLYRVRVYLYLSHTERRKNKREGGGWVAALDMLRYVMAAMGDGRWREIQRQKKKCCLLYFFESSPWTERYFCAIWLKDNNSWRRVRRGAFLLTTVFLFHFILFIWDALYPQHPFYLL